LNLDCKILFTKENPYNAYNQMRVGGIHSLPMAVAFVSIIKIASPCLATHCITLLEETVDPFETLVLERVVTLPQFRLGIAS